MKIESRGISFLTFVASLLVVAAPAAAQTWTGAGADNNWSTGANWSGGVAPASSPATQLTFPGSTPRPSPVVDAPWTVNRLDFQLRNYVVTGQAITFNGSAAEIFSFGNNVPNTLSNPIVLAVPTSITGSGFLVNMTGPISGPGSLTIGGNGATLLAGTSTFTGGVIVVGGGILAIAGSMPGPVTVNFGFFSGSGTVTGPVTVTSLGVLNLSPPLSTGSLTLDAGSIANVAINGAGPGLYGSVSVTGTVDITGATLGLNGPYVPAPGDVFTIIVNDGADPIVGTFSGLAEGATVTFNGVPLRISYVGGTGNDITLSTVAAVAAAGVPTLSGPALVLFAALVLGFGMLGSRRRR